MATEVVDDNPRRAEAVLLLLLDGRAVEQEWQYAEVEGNGHGYSGWIRRTEEGIVEGHTLTVHDFRS